MPGSTAPLSETEGRTLRGLGDSLLYQFGELAHLKSHLNFGRSRLGNPKLRFQMLRRFSGAECCPADVFPPWCVCVCSPSQTEARETATTSLRLNIMLFYNVCCPDWGWKLPSREDLCFTKLLCKANNRPRFSSTWSTTRGGGGGTQLPYFLGSPGSDWVAR